MLLTTSFQAQMTSFPVNIFPNIDALKVPNIIPRSPSSCFFILCFTVSLTPPIDTLEFSTDIMFLIIFSISKN